MSVVEEASGRKEGANTNPGPGVAQSRIDGRKEPEKILSRSLARSFTIICLSFITHPVVLRGEARQTLAEALARVTAVLLHAGLVLAARVEIVDAADGVDGDLLGRRSLALGH